MGRSTTTPLAWAIALIMKGTMDAPEAPMAEQTPTAGTRMFLGSRRVKHTMAPGNMGPRKNPMAKKRRLEGHGSSPEGMGLQTTSKRRYTQKCSTDGTGHKVWHKPKQQLHDHGHDQIHRNGVLFRLEESARHEAKADSSEGDPCPHAARDNTRFNGRTPSYFHHKRDEPST